MQKMKTLSLRLRVQIVWPMLKSKAIVKVTMPNFLYRQKCLITRCKYESPTAFDSIVVVKVKSCFFFKCRSKVMVKVTRSLPWCGLKGFHLLSMHEKYEVSISYGSKVTAKDKVVFFFPQIDTQTGQLDHSRCPHIPFWGHKNMCDLKAGNVKYKCKYSGCKIKIAFDIETTNVDDQVHRQWSQ